MAQKKTDQKPNKAGELVPGIKVTKWTKSSKPGKGLSGRRGQSTGGSVKKIKARLVILKRIESQNP